MTYAFGKGGNLTTVANQATTLTVNTYHFLDKIAFQSNCPAPPHNVTMTATLTCDTAPNAGPFNFGPFSIAEGHTTINVLIPVPAGPPRQCTLVIASRVSFTNGLIIEQTGDQTVSVVEPGAGNPLLPRLSLTHVAGAVQQGHPGDTRSFLYEVTNNDPTETFTGTFTANLRNVADLPTVVAGQNDTRRGVFSRADPGGGDNFPVGFDPSSPADGGDPQCLALPTLPHTTIPVDINLPLVLGPGQSQQVEVQCRSWGLSGNGAAGESSAFCEGSFAMDQSMIHVCTGAVMSANTSMPPLFRCYNSGRATLGFASSIAGVGPAAGFQGDATPAANQTWLANFAQDNAGFQLLVNGVPVTGTNFSGITQVDGQHVRLTSELSFINPPAARNAEFTMILPIVVRAHPNSAGTTTLVLRNASPVDGAPNGYANTYPYLTGSVDVNRTGTLQDAVLDFVHQMSAVGVEQSTFNPVAMTNVRWTLETLGPDRYRVSSTWTATNPGTAAIIGFDVFNDFRGFARRQVFCTGTPGDMNSDGVVDGGDAQAFVDCVVDSTADCGPCADMNFDPSADSDDVPVFVAALLNVPQVYSTPLGPMPATITTDAGDQAAVVEGEIRLAVGPPNRMGVRPVSVQELILGTSSVNTIDDPTGGMTFLLRQGTGSGTWNLINGEFQVSLGLDVGYHLIGQYAPHTPPQASYNDSRQMPKEVWEAFLTATAVLGQGIQSVELNGELTTEVIDAITERVVRMTVPANNVTVPVRSVAAPGCPEVQKCRKRKVCLQPVFGRDDAGGNPAGSSYGAFKASADALWARCCVEFDWQPTQFVDETDFRFIEEAHLQTGLDEMIMLLARVDELGENDCIEIFFVEKMLGPGGLAHELGDGVAFCGGTKMAQIMVADDAVDTCTPPRSLVLAHELGHALGLDNMDTNGDGDEHESGCIMTASGMRPPACPGLNPDQVSLMQCKNLRSPLLKEIMPEVECCKNPNCP